MEQLTVARERSNDERTTKRKWMKDTTSYSVSRTNAMKYGVTTNGPVICPGWDRCRFRWCADKATPGTPCSTESQMARSHEAHYRRVYDYPALRQELADVDNVISKLVNNDLKRRRILLRANEAWKAEGSERQHEFLLADRYFAACLNEYRELLAQIDVARRRVRDALALRRARQQVMPMPGNTGGLSH